MGRLRLTSPGVLLILAIVSAGAIFLMDLFYLRPYVASQKLDALREQANRAEQTVHDAVAGKQEGLLRTCAAWARNPQTRECLAGSPDGAKFRALAEAGFLSADVDLAWLTDASGSVVHTWSNPAHNTVGYPARTTVEKIQAVFGKLDSSARSAHRGLLGLQDGVLLFARQDIDIPGAGTQTPAAATPPPAATLWLGTYLDNDLFKELALAAGAKTISFVTADSLPPAAYADDNATHALWPLNTDDLLAAAWMTRDVSGMPLGYFRAELPTTHIHLLAAAARRMVLIVMALSVGLVLLVILGTHMLITGPVVRLLRRLQKLEGGQGAPNDLSRDLHGEPLVLARRLESAFDRLATISKTDQLTGLANRRHFQEVLDCFYHQARRYNRPLSLIVMDIDFFKAVNDTGGHQAGDELLKAVAVAIEQACRKADLPVRLGGDEFAVLLPETGAADAAAVAERIRETVSGQAIAIRGLQVNVTVSIGITDLNAGEIDSPDSMVSLADRALYRAKELGRNRVTQANNLDGLDWKNQAEGRGKVSILYKKLAGLDSQFKELFVRAVEEIVEILAQRDPHMAAHATKVQHYSVLIAQEMGLPERVTKRIQTAAMLHDIGMLAMPDKVLLCSGELDDQQTYMMRRHPLVSVQIMEGMEFLEQEIPAVRYHHERYDGSGYPEGLAGAAIPLTARILAVADTFVAMTSPRTFRSAKTCQEATGEIEQAAGTQFDPAVVEAFVAAARRLGDKLLEIPDKELLAPIEDEMPLPTQP